MSFINVNINILSLCLPEGASEMEMSEGKWGRKWLDGENGKATVLLKHISQIPFFRLAHTSYISADRQGGNFQCPSRIQCPHIHIFN